MESKIATGWICPKCGRVYSPDTSECWFCNSKYLGEPTCEEVESPFRYVRYPFSFDDIAINYIK